jgi:long-chain acyl-CoA synthetase
VSASQANRAPNAAPKELSIREQLDGGRLLIMGGTGFLGKVFLAMLLDRYPNVSHIWLVVRPRLRKDGTVRQTSEQRFWAEIAPSPVFDPLREKYPGAAFTAFMKQRITPVRGDITQPYCGIPDDIRDELRGTLTAFCNVAGIIDFFPPLDYALAANAFGMKHLVQLVKDLGAEGEAGVRTMHTSTCYVAGDRTGQVEEVDPLEFPFPKADELDRSHWDPEREIAECVDMVDNIRHRSSDAFRQSAFLDKAKKRLQDRNEPCRGSALKSEVIQVKKDYEKKLLVDAGQERALYWGWHNVYTYTKSIGEQILRQSGVPHTIVRPAVIESAVGYPRVGWCEGINTSSPLIYLAMQSVVKFPSADETVLDIIPVDMVAAGMLLALGELIEGTAPVVYQFGSSDTEPLRVQRLIELVGLFKRKWTREKESNPLMRAVKMRLEPIAVDVPTFYSEGPKVNSGRLSAAAKMLGKLATGPLAPVLDPAVKQINGFSRSLSIAHRIQEQFIPFMATHNYRFSAANTRAAHARLAPDERALLPWNPEDIDWRHYMLEVHAPGIMENVVPEIEKKMKRVKRPLKRHDDLLAMLDEVVERHDLAPALLETHEDGFTRISYRALRGQVEAVAMRLAAIGVKPGDRVIVSGQNHPAWPACWFGVLRAGATAVPIDPALEADKLLVVMSSARVAAALVDDKARETFGASLDGVPTLHLREAPAPGAVGTLPTLDVQPDDVASILYTSGTTGDPKGVMLTHENLTSMVASLGSLFPLRSDDRLLSVLPLHHAFEFTCGLLLPLSMGARIVYLDEINGDRLSYGLQEGRITCMVGVPALWQLLERRVRSQVREKGQMFELAFDQGLGLNRRIGKIVGIDLGKLMFGTVHNRFGGSIRILISGGAALPKETQSLFQGLGLQLAEGYGLTEASPVLTVNMPGPSAKAGTVGKAVPGIELRIEAADDKGVGEVWARGPSVMAGYFGNRDATTATLDEAGWLHTGDMGRIDHKGRLTLVGRAKEVVVTSAGENIYLDDVESTIGTVSYVKELVLLGLVDPRGGERLGLLAVPDAEEHDKLSRGDLHDKARAALKDAIAKLPAVQRPAVVHLVDADLPRTATRKVQRKASKEVLERIEAAKPKRLKKGEGLNGPVARAVAAVAGVSESDVHAESDLRAEFQFDSLMFVELASALEGVGTGRPDADRLATAQTVADLTRLVGAAAPVESNDDDDDQGEPLVLPESIRVPLRDQMGKVQQWFNGDVMNTRVIGRANIPQNRPTIVVCNHTSHLDMGIVKYSLGAYGERIASLAAQDYFFEGNRWKVAWFKNFTNVEALDRKSGLRASLRQASEIIDQGRVVLLFPEGTRQTSGQLAEFKPMVGKLALDTNTDILPLYLDGCYDAMPKGSALPTKRGITVRIGRPLPVSEFRRLTEGMKPGKAARHVANLARLAVEKLGNREVLDLSTLSSDAVLDVEVKPLTPVERVEAAARSLETKYDAARVEKPLTWYFSLGAKDGPRWTVSVDAERVQVKPGRPDGSADCIVKTSEDVFSRLVTEAYIPEPAEFISGAIKTNDIPLLIEFSRVFALSEASPS